MQRTIAVFSLGPQVADWALLERRPNSCCLASPAGWPFLPSQHGGCPQEMDHLDKNALVATAAFTGGRCSYPGGAVVASLNLNGKIGPLQTVSPIFWREGPWAAVGAGYRLLEGEGHARKHACCKGTVPTGIGFRMWPLMFRQCWSQALMNTVG